MSVLEHVQLGAENLVQRCTLAGRSLRELGRRRWFWRLSYALWLDSLRGPAHRAARRFAPPATFTDQDLVYGETPIVTAFALLSQAEFPRGGHLIEIGCGRGIVSLVAHLAFGGTATGFEVVPGLVSRGRWLAQALSAEGVEFREEDAAKAQLPSADLFYVTPTTWSPANLKAVTARLAQAPTGSRAVSLTEPLGGDWEIMRKETLLYSWGPSPTYFQRKTIIL